MVAPWRFLIDENLHPPIVDALAAVTESESLVAAMERYFQLIWAYESAAVE